MRNPARWIAIVASFFAVCAVQATTTKLAAHHPRERGAHATYRTARYARQASSSTSHASHTSHSKSHHYAHRHYTRRRRHHHVVLPKGPTAERIAQIQSALARGGYYKGDPTGRWDADTVAAVQKFQSANNIDATGKLDAPTLQKLGLGSDIAGVAAPKPVVPKISTGAPAVAAPSSAPPPTGVPGKPAGSANPAPDAGHVQSAAATSSSANSSEGGGASGTSAIAPSTTSSDSGASDPASASKRAAGRH